MNTSIFKRLAISDKGFVFDPQTGHSYVLNETGLEVLNCLKKDMSENEVIKYIVENYEVKVDQVKQDYLAFIIKLKQYGLIKEEKLKTAR